MEERYKIYSKSYDRIVDASKLDSILGKIAPEHAAGYAAACSTLEHGLAPWRTKLDLACIEAGRRIADAISKEDRQQTAVTLLVDHSGSMRGQRILLAAATTMSIADWLGSLGMKVEVLGFTTVSWHGGHPRRSWRRWRWLRAKKPGRLCELLHIVYRRSDETTPGMPWSVRKMLRADLPKENVDGEALEWAVERLNAINVKKRLLVVLSDGAPVDDATLATNHNDYLANHLRLVTKKIEASNDIVLGAVDICSGYSAEFYTRRAMVEVLDDLGLKTVALIEEMLLEPNRTANA